MRNAGVTGGALYHHFPTKKALALAVIRERVEQEVEETWIEPIRSAASAAAGILTVFHRIGAGIESRGAVSGCPLNNPALELSLADREIRAAMQDLFDRWRLAIEVKLRAEQQAGRLEDLDPEAFATFVVAAYSGAMALAKAGQNAAPLAACARQLECVIERAG
jgi:AcrR family transcriptional regulator